LLHTICLLSLYALVLHVQREPEVNHKRHKIQQQYRYERKNQNPYKDTCLKNVFEHSLGISPSSYSRTAIMGLGIVSPPDM